MMKDDNSKINRRIEMVFFVFILCNLIVVIQLFYLQVFKHSFFKRKAQKMHLSTVKQQIGRGTIYDRAGKKLAMSIKTESICVDPRKVWYKKKVSAYLAKKLGMDRNVILKKFRSKKHFEYIKRKVDGETAGEILSKKFRGVYSRTEEKRFYPMNETASHVIGFTGIDNRGLEGLEMKYEKYLRGKIGRVQVWRDAKRRTVMINKVDIRKAERGGDMYLTLDANIQSKAQEELKQAVEKYRAKSGSVVVMNPKTGAIYAIGNYPDYDPNNFSGYDSSVMRNRAVTDIYEPGSTFKIFTMSAFLKEYPDDTSIKVHCGNGKAFFFDRNIHDHEKYAWLTVPEIIKYSSNIGIVSLALKIKQEKLYKEYSRFGFGKETGVDLPGEVGGILRSYREWDNTTLTSIPYGQEVAVTAVQLARAYAVLANGGYMIQPFIVDKIVKNDRVVYRHKAGKSKRIVSREIREELVKMLEMVTEKDGTGKKAAIDRYAVAGKTGTAQKHNKNGKGYMRGKYVASFIGFLPAENPEVLTLVVVDEPSPVYYGGDVAAPVFREINQMMISHLPVLPGGGRVIAEAQEEKTEPVKLPDFYMKQYSEAKEFLTDNKVRFSRYGFGHHVIGQDPPAGSVVERDNEVSVFIGDRVDGEKVRVYMPDLKGLSIRKTLRVMSAMGLSVKCVGSGMAVEQDPKPGVAVPRDKVCVINFKIGDRS